MREYYLRSGNDHFLPRLFQFIIHESYRWPYVLWSIESVVKNKPKCRTRGNLRGGENVRSENDKTAQFICTERYNVKLRMNGFIGLRPSSGILKNTQERNISGTGSVSVLRWGAGRHLLCWVR
jgi:hypothetical protein